MGGLLLLQFIQISNSKQQLRAVLLFKLFKMELLEKREGVKRLKRVFRRPHPQIHLPAQSKISTLNLSSVILSGRGKLG